MKLQDIDALYTDNQKCAEVIGLTYSSDELSGFTRAKHGTGFSFKDASGKTISDKKVKQQIDALVIPPAWQKVWISPELDGHILATGLDEKGRKQYIYHPQWRAMRDVLKFYRLIAFAACLPRIRKTIDTDLARPKLDYQKVMAVMLWLLDNIYIRIGNDTYYEQNESVGLTTLTDKHIVIAGPVMTLAFRGKSGKDHQITFEHKEVADTLAQLIKQKGDRLFRYKTSDGLKNVESDDVNHHLQAITGQHVSAKDFRTWGGTLMAFNHLAETAALPEDKTPKPEKVIVEAVDAAANVLGNTRTIAKASYVHPDILELYKRDDFEKYQKKAQAQRKKVGLDNRETELIYVLESLFAKEFRLLRNTSDK